MGSFGIAELAEALREAAAEATGDQDMIERVRPLAERAAAETGWLEPSMYACDEEQGFGLHLLHEEEDHSLAVFAAAWLPGRGAPPHNHGTWAVVTGVDGPEKNTFWKRLDDGSEKGRARIEKLGEAVIQPGQVVSLLPDEIHSVLNETDRVTVSLHLYGRHLSNVTRSQFDPERGIEEPFIVSIQ